MYEKYDYLSKVILIGPSGAGKSELLLTMTDEERKFSGDHELTIGVEFGTKMVDVQDKKIKLQIWDTAGEEDFRSITRSYYRGAHVVCVAWDASKPAHILHLDTWVQEAKRQAVDDAVIIFVRCKSDLDNTTEGASDEEIAKQIAAVKEIAAKCEIGEPIIFTTSSKNRMDKTKKTGVPELVIKAAEMGLPLAIEAAEMEVGMRPVPVAKPSEPFFLTERIAKMKHSRRPREEELDACFGNDNPSETDIQWLSMHLDSVEENCRTARNIRDYLALKGVEVNVVARPKVGSVVPDLLKLLDEEERAKFPKFVTLFFFASFSDKYVAERDEERKVILDVAKNIHLGKDPYADLDQTKVPKAAIDIVTKYQQPVLK